MQISDFFYSIQGEGSNVGWAMVFIRFTGCDLSCSFCDEDRHQIQRFEWSNDEVLAQVRGYAAKRVCLTGGEPSLEDRNPLIDALQKAGYWVSVETNGYAPEHVSHADWLTYSPKDLDQVRLGDWFQEIKLLVGQDTSEAKLRQLAAQIQQPCFLQPVTEATPSQTQANVYKARDLILAEPKFRLSLQTQTWIHIP